MASVWITLLDISASMDDGFSTTETPGPFSEQGSWRTKLEAAKELLIRQIADVRVQDVAVITFSDSAAKIFHGPRPQFDQAESAIRDLRSQRNTNLAAALTAITDDPAFAEYEALSVLILTDGLSNRGDPNAAAQQLISKFPFARIDTILIDETEEGRRVAEIVSINGWVRTAFSSVRLGAAVTLGHAEGLNREIRGLTERRLQLEAELASVAEGSPPTLLTVTTPLRITPSSLRTEIAPMLEALQEVQETADAGAGRDYRGQITSISQSSPVQISLSGLRDAVKLVLELIIPWRRDHARRMLTLKEEEAAIENEKRLAQLAREHVELEGLDLENRHREMELAHERIALARARVDLAQHSMEILDPNGRLREYGREVYLHKLIAAIDRLAESDIEFVASGPGFEQQSRRRRR